MPTPLLPPTVTFWLGVWPWTSADGLSTRSTSAGRLNAAPSSKSISSRRSARLTRISTGQGLLALCIGAQLGRDAVLLADRPCLIDQHDRDAVPDRVRQASLLAHQL